ncbi:MAG: UbiH/UbiF/VisC/COQ6 family ubiquinone biosynthesis hydroxylase [Gammaproteobacteria bacterium]|nr:UbiH/UbiF/VisC/COQ6 family ubiquinone biosynthesis hydroxylase [Gammaproteobacteria bacterium]MDH3560178.1 UbiH/UbiF/VisC/COQ6 family ubiquinone biosynthesis hydroxylase [Gammaproteobacteria bacterium]
MNQFDVIIIGGGIVGATAACALGTAGLAVAVVEAREPVADTGVRDARVFAITRASERIFSALGVWDAISARDICAFREMRVWDAGGSGAIHFDCADIGEPFLGHIIEPRFIQTALLERLQTLADVQLFCPAQFSDIEIGENQVTVVLDDATVLMASLVVAADGARSPLREHLGIQVRVHDYRQSGLVALVKTEHGHQETAWQRFLPDGPLAFLPLSGGWSSIVWTLPSAEVERMLALDSEAFHAALGEAFDFRLGRITGSEQRKAFPLRRLHATHYISERAALIGDAAHTIHPLAGQGVNLGLLDAAALAEVLADAQARGKDAGSMPVLRRYERWRRGDNLLMMSAMDAFNLLFSNARPPLRWARNLGLSLMDAAGPAKDVLMRHAMGLEGDLPALARIPEEVSRSA